MKMNSPYRDDNDDWETVELAYMSEEDLDEITEDQMVQLLEAENGEESDEEELPVVDMALTTFSNHNKPVFACDICSSKNLAVTGGEDDKAFVWNINTGEILFECDNHRDSVVCVKFSPDGTLVATGDMEGYIQVWKVSTQSKIWDFEVSELTWLLWHHKANILYAGTGGGEIWMWLIRRGDTKTFPSFGSECTCADLSHDGTKIVAGYDNGEVRTFDCRTASLIHCYSGANMSESSITQVGWHRDKPLVICSAVSGEAKILNTNTGSVVATYACQDIKPDESVDVEETGLAVETCSFCPSVPHYAVTGNLPGVISTWDLTSHSGRHHIIQGTGTTRIMWHPTKPLFYAACLDSVIRVYEVYSGQIKKKLTGHTRPILDIVVSQDGKFVITASDDGTAKVFLLQEDASS